MHLPVVRTLSRCMYPIKQESPSGVMYLWKCLNVLCIRCDLWMEICGIFHYFPVYIHAYDLSFPPRYDLVTLQATTEKGPEVVALYIKHFRHGISCVEAVGGYSGRKMYLLNTVISSYEIADAVHVMQEADEHVIINVLKTEQFVGHFYRAPME